MGKYQISCVKCGEIIKKEPFDFSCPADKSLGRTVYPQKKLIVRKKPGIWRFIDWLPVQNSSHYSEKPVTYKSLSLAEEIGLKNLYISFSGYWPEQGVKMETCTFKELEGAVTVQYAKELGVESLVIASAGNTAKAFASMAMQEQFKVVLVIPEKCLCGVYLPGFDSRYAKTMILKGRISQIKGFVYEGGAENIARRDGLGTVMLNAALEVGGLPEHYFQAVGSGTGAIAAFEAALRLKADGSFGAKLPKLHLAQNLPVAPMYNAWRDGRRWIDLERDVPRAENVLDLVYARVLSNRYPPYGVVGGVYDALIESRGEMYGVENRDGRRAKRLFERLEGIDILPAAAVSVSALLGAVEKGSIGRDETVLLNITGGGGRRLRKDKKLQRIKVDCSVSKNISDSELKELRL
jgi:cysteate synthase